MLFLNNFRSIFYTLILSTLFITPAMAVEKVSLYDSQLLIPADADQKTLQATIEEGFLEVLVRVSGLPSIKESDTRIQKVRSEAKTYLQSISFSSTELTLKNAIGHDIPTKVLNMQFNESQINLLLIQNYYPVWTAYRPNTLVIVQLKDKGVGYIGDGEHMELTSILNSQAKLMGLPVTLPSFELEDEILLANIDLMNATEDQLLELQTRYPSYQILIATLNPNNPASTSQWRLLKNGKIRTGETKQKQSVVDMMNELVLVAVEPLRNDYGVVYSRLRSTEIQLTLTGVENLKDYSSVERYFQGIAGVLSVNTIQVKKDSITFELFMAMSRSQFEKLLKLRPIIVPIDQDEPDPKKLFATYQQGNL